MPRPSLTRVVTFSAAHRYHRPDWSEERNRATFGACANEHGHGHTYRCAVTVTGPLHPDTSMIVDLEMLDHILDEEIVRPLDHQHINHAIPEFAFGRTIPTGEAVARYLWSRVAPRLPAGVFLHRVRVQEDDRLYADCYGPDDEERTS
jgi:6-pyruvoyltetrahydropterin/6-carboxytetrahydropterin synthase